MRRVIANNLPLTLDGSWELDGSKVLSGLVNEDILDASSTYLAQYANSPVLTALIEAFNEELDPGADSDAFVALVMDLSTAQGFGLDIWGRIVGINRKINLLPPEEYLGFNEAKDAGTPPPYPFGQRPFYYQARGSTDQYELSDEAFRVLIFAKALANISVFTAPSVNRLLLALFAGRGQCYVQEMGSMTIQYVFNFSLQPWEKAVVSTPSLLPRPAGVNVLIQINA